MRVLLLHAGIADGRMWAPQVDALRAAGHEPRAPDLPGFGEEPLVPPTVDYVAFAAGLLDRPAAVVGCSFGGRVALELAGAAEQQARTWLAPDAARDVHELTVAMTLRSYEQQLPVDGQVQGAWPQPSAEERLPELRVPTLVVVGDRDRPELDDVARRLVRELPDARHETIAGAGHLLGVERPEELNRLLLDFLQ